ncbi:2-hydroxyacyl-CoA lyase 1-like [Mytilus galloprovincialis]|uniref:2-hydroxyacyl-CoA lyase 1-like n=1 Tax=Mytilus galloprovincialis TaxID=29158 RepID=UPI003F7B39ED
MADDTKTMDGAHILCTALKAQGVEYMFGIVGIPVTEIAMAAQEVGIRYIGMRNEQAASYGASIIGYMTRKPAVCLVVSGPGLVHALAGMSNAMENCWPMIVIGGSSEQDQEGMDAFQECPQVDIARPFSKYTARPNSTGRIPFYVEKAVRFSTFGRPGPVYLDFPGNMINQNVLEKNISPFVVCPPPPLTLADPDKVRDAADLLYYAQKPLVIIGKGAAYAQAENSVRELVEGCKLPFLPTPMGKGVLPDDHPLCVAPARSIALQEADVIVLLGARLNWILHFGLPPRFNPKVKIIQIDICAEQMGNNVQSAVSLVGDCNVIVQQINDVYGKMPGKFAFSPKSPWWKTLTSKVQANQQSVQQMIDDKSVPMNYFAAYDEIRSLLPKDCIIVSEGANTMDISRTMILNSLPRHRLDAGSYGTMGVGLGFVVAAAAWCKDHTPNKKVVSIQGDSAFGFSGMELETICRYKLPVVMIIMNNNGIYNGLDGESWESLQDMDLSLSLPPSCLTVDAHYERMIEAFGGKGYFVRTAAELKSSLTTALNSKDQISLINVMISPQAQRKPQDFFWLTKSKI